MKVISHNRKAYYNYSIEEKFEAGIALTGTEIKSVRAGRVNMGDGYARSEKGELWLYNIHIAKYDPGSRANHEPRRTRKLLLHRRQINELSAQVMQRGYTLVPLRMYLKNGIAKVELGLARGKKLYDKRESIARRDAEQRMERALKLAKQKY
jgi:SsrA-binding protein